MSEMTPDPTDAELDEIEAYCDHTTGRIIKALRACRQRSKAAIEVLQDWENTPGNHRDAAWWHEWERKRRAALDKEVGDANR